jgi:hypothetical protein
MTDDGNDKVKEPRRAWLVNHLNFKRIDNRNAWIGSDWTGSERHLIDQCSSEDFLIKLQNNLAKTEVVS